MPTQATVGLVAYGIHDGGGEERAAYELVHRLYADYRYVVFSSELDPRLRPLVDWHRIWSPRRPAPVRFLLFFAQAGLLIGLARSRLDLLHTVGAIVPNRTDMTTVQFCYAGFRSRLGLTPPSKPFLWRLNTAINYSLRLAAERWLYQPKRLRLLAAASTGIAEELRAHYPNVPIEVTPNGVDGTRFGPDNAVRQQVRLEEGADDDDVIALFVGGDWERKGLALVIEALGGARKQGRTSIGLWVVGRGDRARYRALAERYNVADAVRFFGFRRDTERFYKAADLFVFPTLYEAFPLAALEAAAAGLPILATAANGIQDLLGDGEAGLVLPRSADAFASALVDLAADSERREALGQGALKRSQSYSWDAVLATVAALYRRLLSGGAGRHEPERGHAP